MGYISGIDNYIKDYEEFKKDSDNVHDKLFLTLAIANLKLLRTEFFKKWEDINREARCRCPNCNKELPEIPK